MKYFYLFLLAFGLNWVWENLHAGLYVHYQGGGISEFILTRAAIWDAVIILVLVTLLNFFAWSRSRSWLLLILGVIVAIGIEWWALETGRWNYGALMPIVPILGTGLTPTIQLALTGYFSYWLIFRQRQKHS